MTEREELKTCRCGKSDVDLQRYSDDGSPDGIGRVQYFRGVCSACGRFADRDRHPLGAIKKWNNDTMEYRNCRCGCQPEKVRYDGWVYIECRGCGTLERGFFSDDAREKWNRRMEQEV